MLLGSPGSGKGTQALRLKEKFGLAVLSPGDLLRAEMMNGTALGRRAGAAIMTARSLARDGGDNPEDGGARDFEDVLMELLAQVCSARGQSRTTVNAPCAVKSTPAKAVACLSSGWVGGTVPLVKPPALHRAPRTPMSRSNSSQPRPMPLFPTATGPTTRRRAFFHSCGSINNAQTGLRSHKSVLAQRGGGKFQSLGFPVPLIEHVADFTPARICTRAAGSFRRSSPWTAPGASCWTASPAPSAWRPA